ncbi:unnamed protein product [Clavelina lepadiformis]|uniref:Uncharacterized protein n=1 Tax=Clavelina lepadiformis TaxID=159417 RepID=A0ABP0EXW4_CLALP
MTKVLLTSIAITVLFVVQCSSQIFTPDAALRIFNVTFTLGSTVSISSTTTNVFASQSAAEMASFGSNIVLINSACSFSGNSACHEDATCTDLNATLGIFRCRCNSGYNQTASTMTFDPDNSIIPDGTNCPDIDECSNTTICGAQTFNCTNLPGNYTCTCNSGYELDTSRICIDIDECTANTDNCHANATCTNTEGSFTCACDRGFSGDGVSCTEIDECTSLSITCGDNGTCTDPTGETYFCNCDTGFTENTTADPKFCQDVDECSNTSSCDSQASCTNTAGSFSCACNSGYTGTGVGSGSCSNINECASNPCDGNATCADSAGSYTCTCNDGYSGNGTFCEEAGEDYYYRLSITLSTATSGTVDSRRSDVTTATNNFLEELTNSSTLGFSYNSSSITVEAVQGNSSETEFIVEICFNQSSKTAAELTTILSNFTFTTAIGSDTISVAEYNECLTNYGNCSDNANCTNTDGSFTCECLETYADRSTGDVNGTVCELPTSFTCSAETVNVTAYLPYFTNLGINETELLLGNCSGTVSGENLSFNGECNPSISENNTHIFYAWNLTNINESATVTIGQYVTIPITCTFVSSQNVTFNVSAERKDIIFGDSLNNEAGESFGFTATPFLDESTSNAVSGPVTTDRKLYFSLGTTAALPSTIKIQVRSFYTTPAGNTQQSIQLISNRCEVEQTNENRQILETLSVIRQGTGSTALVAVDAHFYGTSTVTVAHFEVVACNEAGGSSCAEDCSSSRRRRSIIQARMRREDVESGEVETAFERAPDDACNRVCGVGICVLDAARQPQCVCSDNAYKNAAGECEESNLVEVPETPEASTPEDRTTIFILIGLACVLVVALIALIAAFFVRKRAAASKSYDMSSYVNTHDITN